MRLGDISRKRCGAPAWSVFRGRGRGRRGAAGRGPSAGAARRAPMADEPQPRAMRFPLAVRRPIEPGPWPNDNVRAELGEAIRGLRRYHLLTQRELEEVTGIDQTVISRLEGGRHVHIRLSRLLALLGAMGVVRISFRSRYTGASVAAWMSRTSDVAHSDVMRPP